LKRYVKEDQEEEGQAPAHQGQSRQAPQHGSRLSQLLAGLQIADASANWRDVGFLASEGHCVVGGVTLTFDAECDGLVLGEPSDEPALTHANGVVAIDHIVQIAPSLADAIAAWEARGVPCRRVREGAAGDGRQVRQAFFRLGSPILEVVEAPGGEAVELWGITFAVADVDATAAFLGAERCSAPKPAVQGGRIASLRRSAGLALPVAFIEPAGVVDRPRS
jgi:hypothetical protein